MPRQFAKPGDLLPALAATFMLVFARIGAMVMLLPGLGEANIPVRIKLAIALLATFATQRSADLQGTVSQATALTESWKQTAGNWFNIGGLIGTLLTVPASKLLGRRTMFAIYFLASGISVLAAFGLLGFIMRRHGFPTAPAVIGLILGPMAEAQLRRALQISLGDPMILLENPGSANGR